MKSLLIAVVLVLACKSIPAPVTNVVTECADSSAVGLIDDVNTALATGDYVAALEKLVTQYGECLVEKAVQMVIAKADQRAQFDDLAALQKSRAQTWIASRKK
jgi:hypothetical protein